MQIFHEYPWDTPCDSRCFLMIFVLQCIGIPKLMSETDLEMLNVVRQSSKWGHEKPVGPDTKLFKHWA